MEFTCDGNVFAKSIELVEKSISTRTTLHVLENIYLHLEGSTLTLRGNDLEIGIENQIQVHNASGSGAVLVKSKTLSAITSKLSSQKISVKVSASNKLQITSNSITFDIHGSDANDYPVFPKLERGLECKFTVRELKNVLKTTAFSISSDVTKPFMNGILVNTDGQQAIFVSTDGFRLSEKRLEKPGILGISGIIPSKAIGELQKIIQSFDPDETIQMSISSNQAAFIAKDFMMMTRLIQAQFPDYRLLIANTPSYSFKVNRTQLLDAADRAGIIAFNSNALVRFYVEGDVLTIKAYSPALGEFVERILVQELSNSVQNRVVFNLKLIIDAMKVFESENLVFQSGGEIGPTVIRGQDDIAYTHVVMPVRASDYQEAPTASVAASVTH